MAEARENPVMGRGRFQMLKDLYNLKVQFPTRGIASFEFVHFAQKIISPVICLLFFMADTQSTEQNKDFKYFEKYGGFLLVIIYYNSSRVLEIISMIDHFEFVFELIEFTLLLFSSVFFLIETMVPIVCVRTSMSLYFVALMINLNETLVYLFPEFDWAVALAAISLSTLIMVLLVSQITNMHSFIMISCYVITIIQLILIIWQFILKKKSEAYNTYLLERKMHRQEKSAYDSQQRSQYYANRLNYNRRLREETDQGNTGAAAVEVELHQMIDGQNVNNQVRCTAV